LTPPRRRDGTVLETFNMSRSVGGRIIGGLCVVAGVAALGVLAAAPSLIGFGPANATALTLAGGVFTVALAAAVRH
jgi:hypothetical protein